MRSALALAVAAGLAGASPTLPARTALAGPARSQPSWHVDAMLHRESCAVRVAARVSGLPVDVGPGRLALAFDQVGARWSVPPQQGGCREDLATYEALSGRTGILVRGAPPALVPAVSDVPAGPAALLSMVAVALTAGDLSAEATGPVSDAPQGPAAPGVLPSAPLIWDGAREERRGTTRFAARGDAGAAGAALGAERLNLAADVARSDGSVQRAVAILTGSRDREVLRLEVRARGRARKAATDLGPLYGLRAALDRLGEGLAAREGLTAPAGMAAGHDEDDGVPPADTPPGLRAALWALRASALHRGGDEEAAAAAAGRAAELLGHVPAADSLAAYARRWTCWREPANGPVATLQAFLDAPAPPRSSFVTGAPDSAVTAVRDAAVSRRELLLSCPELLPAEDGWAALALSEPGGGEPRVVLLAKQDASWRVAFVPVPGAEALVAADTSGGLGLRVLRAAAAAGLSTPCDRVAGVASAVDGCLALLAGSPLTRRALALPAPFGPALAMHEAWDLRGAAAAAWSLALGSFGEDPVAAPPSVRQVGGEVAAELGLRDETGLRWIRSAASLPARSAEAAAALARGLGPDEPGAAMDTVLVALARWPRHDLLAARLAELPPEPRVGSWQDAVRGAFDARQGPAQALLLAHLIDGTQGRPPALDFLREYAALHPALDDGPSDERISGTLDSWESPTATAGAEGTHRRHGNGMQFRSRP